MTRTRRPSGSVSAGTSGVTVGALTEPTSLTSVLSCATWGEFIAPTLSIPRARRHTEGGAARPAFWGPLRSTSFQIWVLGGISGGQGAGASAERERLQIALAPSEARGR